jgi:hypothetical protein
MAMGHIVLDVSMSLDGFIAGPNDEVDRLHQWAFGGKTDADAEILDAGVTATGAVVMGRRTFDLHPSGPYGLPAFVVTPRCSETARDRQFGDHIRHRRCRIRPRASSSSRGWQERCGQCMREGLLNELHFHLGAGLAASGDPAVRTPGP